MVEVEKIPDFRDFEKYQITAGLLIGGYYLKLLPEVRTSHELHLILSVPDKANRYGWGEPMSEIIVGPNSEYRLEDEDGNKYFLCPKMKEGKLGLRIYGFGEYPNVTTLKEFLFPSTNGAE
jgi:hypothetical protein